MMIPIGGKKEKPNGNYDLGPRFKDTGRRVG